MPHAALTLIPGVNQNRTTAMNQAAISTSNLIRFIPDQQLGGIIQKLGGWTKIYFAPMTTTVKALWAWADVNNIYYLAAGCLTTLNVISYGFGGTSSPIAYDVTPLTDTNDVTVDVTTTIGSNQILIKDVGSNISNYDSVFIATQISVGGIVLYGMYQCTGISPDTYYIYSIDNLGRALPATATVLNGGNVPTFTTTAGESIVDVTLADHGFVVGDTFPLFIPMTIGGITLPKGNYTVVDVASTTDFSIQGSNVAATNAGPTAMNSGNAEYIYSISSGPGIPGTGFGVGGFGVGGFGSGVTPTPNPGTPITATDWFLDNWGSFLVALPYQGNIYTWDPLSNEDVATAIPQAPPYNNGMFVAMPQRQIIAWGSTFNGIIDNLLVRWCDVGNFRSWIAQVQNQAGSYRLTRGSRIVGGMQGPQQGLLWTDVGIWAMQYIGQPDIYSFNEIGRGCGLIASRACGAYAGIVYWMGARQFYSLTGDGVLPIYCPIWDVIFQQLDTDNVELIRCAVNSLFGEISWFIPTKTSNGTVVMYVKYNIIVQQWDYGTMGRTAWIDQSILGPPIGADQATNFLYQHETSNDADGQAMSPAFTTGYFAVAEGDQKVFIDQVWPDMKWGLFGGTMSANVSITFYTADYPGDTPKVYGPFTVTSTSQFVTPRFRARLVSVSISSNDFGSFWRLGQVRYRTQTDGKYY